MCDARNVDVYLYSSDDLNLVILDHPSNSVVPLFPDWLRHRPLGFMLIPLIFAAALSIPPVLSPTPAVS
jgi:hypothetical protein